MNSFFFFFVEEFNTDISMKPNQERNIFNLQYIGPGSQYEYSMSKLIKHNLKYSY
jgi:hypothetical protein